MASVRRFPTLLLAALCACAGPSPRPDAGSADSGTSQPSGFADGVSLFDAVDLDPSPGVLEVNLTARPAEVQVNGLRVTRWTYDGHLPGPRLRANVGDRVVVHFKNELPEATTIHWHGVKVPADMDGSEATQAPIPPGGTFDYRFTTTEAGLFWYHPHLDSSTQIGAGLYGAIEVVDPDEPALGDPVTLVLSDESTTDAGVLLPGDESGWFGDYFGREGNTLLVNGRVRPTLKARAGVPQRWKLLNASRARFYQLKIPGAQVQRIGGDVGLIAAPQPGNGLILTPGERAELWVNPMAPATTASVQWLDSDRFHLGAKLPAQDLFVLETIDAPLVDGAVTPPTALRTIAALDVSDAGTRRLELMEKAQGGIGVLGINGLTYDESKASPIMVHLGDTEVWEVANTTGYDHSFHLHGYSFQPLDSAGQPWPVREWKDTVLVPAKRSLHLAVRFDDRPGMWMLHCHIIDHVTLGMMAMLHVMP